jgi:hypothetical protein
MPLKLGKKVVKQETNPFRPKGPVTRRFTLCRISLAEKGLTLFEDYGVVVDLDDEPLFLKEFESLVPSNERYFDRDHEIYHVAEKHLNLVKNLACDYYERVVFKPAVGNEIILKAGSSDLTVRQAEGKTNEPVSTA